MLTRLRLENWRSIKSETIDFTTPITVFIGANSSGKTNVLDALRFYRDSLQKTLVPVVLELGYAKILRNAYQNTEPVELGFTLQTKRTSPTITEVLNLHFDKRDVPFKFRKRLFEGDELLHEDPLEELPVRDVFTSFTYEWDDEQARRKDRARLLLPQLYTLVRKRWQILGDSFVPPLHLTGRDGGDPYVIEPDARNVLVMLNFMQQVNRDLYERLQEDFSWLLERMNAVEIWQKGETRELELLLREQSGIRAPTVSTGTARILAMLTAFYALEMPQEAGNGAAPQILTPDLPGLVIIEEPDTAINPGLLEKFVEQLRVYTEDEDKPRQVLMTTHNPRFLDYFKPEEVRVVERDESGYTRVKKLPEHIHKVWLNEYTLGEVWMTRSLGGLPE